MVMELIRATSPLKGRFLLVPINFRLLSYVICALLLLIHLWPLLIRPLPLLIRWNPFPR